MELTYVWNAIIPTTNNLLQMEIEEKCWKYYSINSYLCMNCGENSFQQRYIMFIVFTYLRILNKIWKWTLETQHRHWIQEHTHVHLHRIQ